MALFLGTTNNTIGGTAKGAGNVIANNPNGGVYLTNAGTSGNLVAGNIIGNSNGAQHFGVEIAGGAGPNNIGADAGGNTITTGDNETGIAISDLGSNGNSLINNAIRGTGNSQFAAPGWPCARRRRR